MPNDPRTLLPIKEEIDCHLIPKTFSVSGMTIRGEKQIDNAIGEYCDVELKKYFEYVLGEKLAFTVAMDRGSKTLRATGQNLLSRL